MFQFEEHLKNFRILIMSAIKATKFPRTRLLDVRYSGVVPERSSWCDSVRELEGALTSWEEENERGRFAHAQLGMTLVYNYLCLIQELTVHSPSPSLLHPFHLHPFPLHLSPLNQVTATVLKIQY